MKRCSLFVLICCLTACGAPRGQVADPLSDLAGKDLAALDLQAYVAAVKRIGAVTGEQYPLPREASQTRVGGPLAVWALTGGALVVEGQGKRWIFSHINAEGRLQWRESLELGVPAGLAQWKVAAAPSGLGGQLLVVGGLSGGRVNSIFWGLGAKGLLLARAEDSAGKLDLANLGHEHPALSVPKTKLTSTDPWQVLAALVRLARPEAAEERLQDATQSALAELAGSTHLWVAEAAALVATQR